MQNPISLKSAERRVFQTTFSDGLWDVLIGCFILMFALAPLISDSLGDFWSSFIFLPFWGLIYLAIRLARKHLIAPRIGSVKFGKSRQRKMRAFNRIMLVVNALALLAGILAYTNLDSLASGRWFGLVDTPILIMSLFLIIGFSIAATLLDFPRLYLYGLLLFLAPFFGEWLYTTQGAAHHGFPITFGISAALMILTGLVLFIHTLKTNPVVETPGA